MSEGSHRSQSGTRTRKLTDRARLNKLGELQQERSCVIRNIYKLLQVIDKTIEENGNHEQAVKKSSKLQELFQQLMLLHGRCQLHMTSEEDSRPDEELVDRVDRDISRHRKRFNSWLSKQGEIQEDKGRIFNYDGVSSRSVSQKSSNKPRLEDAGSKSSRSRSSRASALMLKEKARLAELKVEEEYAQQQKVKEQQLLKLQEENEKMKLQKEIHKTKARLKVYEESIDEEVFEGKLPSLPDVPKYDKFTEDYIEKLQAQSTQGEASAKFLEVHNPIKENLPSKEFSKLLKLAKAPVLDIDTFSGNSTDFPYFITTFTQAVEENVSDERGKLARLIKYTQGEPHELVKSCVYLAEDRCYERAKELLQTKYGSPYKITSEYRKQLTSWPRLKANEPASFDRFENFLLKFEASMMSIGRSGEFNPELIQQLQSKLPPYLQERWNRKVFQLRRNKDRESRLTDFIQFVSDETLILSDPLFSRGAIGELNKPSDSNSKSKFSSYSTVPKERMCICCKKPWHDLEKCYKYTSMELGGRRKFIYQNRLCFCCLKSTSSQHVAKTCSNKRSCDVCKQDHPTSLHDYARTNAPTDQVTSCSTNISENSSLCIVAVRIHHDANPDRSIETLALLDNGSQGTFVCENLLNHLDAPSVRTSLEIQTVTGRVTEKSTMVKGLRIQSANEDLMPPIILPKVFSRTTLPSDVSDVPTISKLKKWKYLKDLEGKLPDVSKHKNIGILIGSNCPKALEPLEIIHSRGEGPFAFRTRLGWCVTGQMDFNQTKLSCNRIQVIRNDTTNHFFQVKEAIKDLSLKDMIIKSQSLDFHETSYGAPTSLEDKKFLNIMEGAYVKDYHYYLPLPLRNKEKLIPNNRQQSIQRAMWLKQRLLKNDKMYEDYKRFMDKIIEKGYAKAANEDTTMHKTWYIPHHGVYHPRKPEKIRVVFDCTAKFKGYCLNEELIQGPDLTNQLVGVLLRFREEPVAVMADIEAMFHQVRVPEEFHDNLRFVWWPNGNLSGRLVDYQMCVHLFGATSSPSCANFALHKAADDNKSTYGEEAAKILHGNFYVDDMLKSFSSTTKAISTATKVIGMCKAGGFRLTQFVSNDRKFLSTIPEEERAKSLKDFDMSTNPLPTERALGMKWSPENDFFTFQITMKEKPLTRRGVLSSISTIYDPLGFASPYLLEGKKLLQEICSEKCGWDDPLNSEQSSKWIKWKAELIMLEQLQIDRCIRPKGFKDVVSTSLYHFSDASADAYGQVSYVRFLGHNNEISCKILMSKSRVAPMKRPTIPRLELTAAVVSVKVSLSLAQELEISVDEQYFWTDSQVVLSYLSNESKRFHLYVSNRVQFIRDHTSISDWKYVPSQENPADDVSRGLSLSTTKKNQRWIGGPEFLYQPEGKWPPQPKKYHPDNEDKEIRKKVFTVKVECDEVNLLEERVSSWLRFCRVIARMLQLSKKGRKLDVLLLQKAEKVILRSVQRRAFPDVKLLNENQSLKKQGTLCRLSPFIDQDGLLRVGGRISNSEMSDELKHPIILPRRSRTTTLIVEAAHKELHHSGRNATLCRLREKGFWVVNGNSLVRHIISKCVSCRMLRGRTATQKMADLPPDRMKEAPPFTYVGTDMFGPFTIKERRSTLKRYGIIFTCLCSRAVHLESVSSMDTDAFIQCLRRFIGRRGNIRLLRCDNGTNFVGARNELSKALNEMDEQSISNFLLSLGADFISWKHNTPHASNHGGVWERMIRSTRAILDALMLTHGQSLNDESFRTLLVEVEATINSRPLTVECINDPESLTPISPSNLLTMKSNVVLPPPGKFVREDLFCRRRWRRIQHIANEFWSRWRKEYLSNLQSRSKWSEEKQNLNIGDIVLVKDDNVSRNQWKLAIVEKVMLGDDNKIRTVEIRQGQKCYVRPINKLVVIVETDNKFLDEDPK